MSEKLRLDPNWQPPPSWQKITTLDVHTAGEPLRIIIDYPELSSDTMLEKRCNAKTNFDHLRTALMWEPRGHADMYGCIITPPVTPQAHFGVLFLHNEGYSTMCGHGIIAIATAALQTGMLQMRPPETEVKIDTPAGLVTAFARISEDRVTSVRFYNVPAFVVALDETIEVSGVGSVSYDLAFGGAFYAFVKADDVGLTCSPKDFRALIEAGMRIKRAVMASRAIEHPFEADLNFLYGTIFTGPPENSDHHSRNVCIFAEGEVDRSPTGTGVSARVALEHARNNLAIGEEMVIESIIGSTFRAALHQRTTFGPYAAVIPEVEGSAFLTGRHEFWLDPNDASRHGFILR